MTRPDPLAAPSPGSQAPEASPEPLSTQRSPTSRGGVFSLAVPPRRTSGETLLMRAFGRFDPCSRLFSKSFFPE